LYRETLRRQKVLGLCFLLFSVLIMGVTIAVSYVSYNNAYYSLPSAAEMTFVLIIFMFAGGLTMAMHGFGFLARRGSSDFYHSLPVTRTCMFFSMAAASLTWIYITIAGTLIAVWLGYTITGMPFVPVYLLYALGFYITGTTLVFAAASIAVSITGTRFSNLILTGLVLFLPRFISLMIAVGTLNVASVVPASELGVFLNGSYNLVTGLVFSVFIGESVGMGPGEMFYNTSGMIYTIALALIELAIAWLLFRRRRSETAEYSAPSRPLQVCYSCALAMPFFLMLAVLSAMSQASTNVCAILIVLGISAFFIYQLISSRSVKLTFKSLPWVFVPAALSAILAVYAHSAGTVMLNTVPDSTDIAGVTFTTADNYYGQMTYNDLFTREVEFTGADVVNLAAGQLKDTVETYSEGYMSRSYVRNSVGVYKIIFRLKTGATLVRNVWLDDRAYTQLQTIMAANQQYEDAAYKLPEVGEVYFANLYPLSNQQAMELFKILRDELSALSYDQRAKVLSSGGGYPTAVAQAGDGEATVEPIYTFGVVSVNGSVGTKLYSTGYLITPLTPKAASYYMSCYNAHGAEDFETAKADFQEQKAAMAESGQVNLSVNIAGADGTMVNYNIYYYEGTSQIPQGLTRQAIIDVADMLLKGETCADVSQPYYTFTLYGDMTGFTSPYMRLSNDQMKAVTERLDALQLLMSEQKEKY
jgi:ABC-2 type transport system permease protein